MMHWKYEWVADLPRSVYSVLREMIADEQREIEERR